MHRPKVVKRLGFAVILLSFLLWAGVSSLSRSVPNATSETPKGAKTADENYVGSEACKDCHEDQFKNFSHTPHAKLAALSSWKGKVSGCEGCHGPGKAHMEEGDPAKIISFKNKSAKAGSETCLACHAGREEHNNFRRGEHWRNDVGCTE